MADDLLEQFSKDFLVNKVYAWHGDWLVDDDYITDAEMIAALDAVELAAYVTSQARLKLYKDLDHLGIYLYTDRFFFEWHEELMTLGHGWPTFGPEENLCSRHLFFIY